MTSGLKNVLSRCEWLAQLLSASNQSCCFHKISNCSLSPGYARTLIATRRAPTEALLVISFLKGLYLYSKYQLSFIHFDLIFITFIDESASHGFP